MSNEPGLVAWEVDLEPGPEPAEVLGVAGRALRDAASAGVVWQVPARLTRISAAENFPSGTVGIVAKGKYSSNGMVTLAIRVTPPRYAGCGPCLMMRMNDSDLWMMGDMASFAGNAGIRTVAAAISGRWAHGRWARVEGVWASTPLGEQIGRAPPPRIGVPGMFRNCRMAQVRFLWLRDNPDCVAIEAAMDRALRTDADLEVEFDVEDDEIMASYVAGEDDALRLFFQQEAIPFAGGTLAVLRAALPEGWRLDTPGISVAVERRSEVLEVTGDALGGIFDGPLLHPAVPPSPFTHYTTAMGFSRMVWDLPLSEAVPLLRGAMDGDDPAVLEWGDLNSVEAEAPERAWGGFYHHEQVASLDAHLTVRLHAGGTWIGLGFADQDWWRDPTACDAAEATLGRIEAALQSRFPGLRLAPTTYLSTFVLPGVTTGAAAANLQFAFNTAWDVTVETSGATLVVQAWEQARPTSWVRATVMPTADGGVSVTLQTSEAAYATPRDGSEMLGPIAREIDAALGEILAGITPGGRAAMGWTPPRPVRPAERFAQAIDRLHTG